VGYQFIIVFRHDGQLSGQAGDKPSQAHPGKKIQLG
jgi:hypothetical protein